VLHFFLCFSNCLILIYEPRRRRRNTVRAKEDQKLNEGGGDVCDRGKVEETG
jgi:hypothetical protein